MVIKKTFGDSRFVQPLLPWVGEESVELLKLGYSQAKAAHYNQWRQDGRRYFEHVRGVAVLVRDIAKPHLYFKERVAVDMLITALFHDLEEDKPWVLPLKFMAKLFGKRVADNVRLLSKDDHSKPVYFERLHQSKSIIALIVKLCDRLYNMSDLKGCDDAKKRKQLIETREKVLPLCDTLEKVLCGEQKQIAITLRKKLIAICKKVERELIQP